MHTSTIGHQVIERPRWEGEDCSYFLKDVQCEQITKFVLRADLSIPCEARSYDVRDVEDYASKHIHVNEEHCFASWYVSHIK